MNIMLLWAGVVILLVVVAIAVTAYVIGSRSDQTSGSKYRKTPSNG